MVQQKEVVNPMLCNLNLDFPIDVEHFGPALSIEPLVVYKYGLSLVVERDQPLLNDLSIVVNSSTGFPAVQQPSPHHLVRNVNVHQQFHLYFIPHDFVPGFNVALAAGEAVDQNQLTSIAIKNLLFDADDHILAGHHLAFFHQLGYMLGLLGSSLQKLTQDVAD